MLARTRARSTTKINSKIVYILIGILPNTWWTRSENHRGRAIQTSKPPVFYSGDSRAIPASQVQTIYTIENLKVDERLGLTWLVLQALRSSLEQSSWPSAKDTNPKRKIAATQPSIKRSELDQMGRRNR
jgi:hypothetical protein